MNTSFFTLIIVAIIGTLILNYKSVKDCKVAEAGEYSQPGRYENITPLKHDFFKQFSVLLMISLIFDKSFSNKQLIDFNDPFNSPLGRAIIVASCFVVYYAFVQPVANYLPRF